MRITKGQYIGIVSVLIILLSVYLFNLFRKKDISANRAETVGYINGYFRGTKSGPSARYIYHVDNKKYDGSHYIESDEYPKYKGRFYKVKYSSQNPKWSEILLDFPVTDTLVIKASGLTLPKEKTNQFQVH